jgi:ParB family transcriptional regulator, chromosome partitioning protein
MEVETHQLIRRYEHLRRRHPPLEKALLSSLAESGQRLPVVVVAEDRKFVLIDGYKRVRALERLRRDTVQAIVWEVQEVEALLLERGLRRGSEDVFDQAWLLAEMQERFGWSLEKLARAFEHSRSWVSSRLALIQVLPGEIQEQVRLGSLSAHAAMKYLVPLARVDAQAAQQLATAISPIQPTGRQVGLLCEGWNEGTQKTRDLILASPQVYLQAQAAQEPAPPSATQRFLNDIGALGGIARRGYRALQEGLMQRLLDSERTEVMEAFARANTDLKRLIDRMELENRT